MFILPSLQKQTHSVEYLYEFCHENVGVILHDFIKENFHCEYNRYICPVIRKIVAKWEIVNNQMVQIKIGITNNN